MSEAQFLETSSVKGSFMAGRLFKSALYILFLNFYNVVPLFRVFDYDNSGTMDFEEFMLASNCTSLTDPGAKLRWKIVLVILVIIIIIMIIMIIILISMTITIIMIKFTHQLDL